MPSRELPSASLMLPCQDLELPSTDLMLPLADFDLPCQDFELPSADFVLRIVDLKLLTADLEHLTAKKDCQLLFLIFQKDESLFANSPLPRESLRVVLPRANPFAWFYNLKY